ncbi:MAG: hypothetical protein ACRD5R_09995 [Candidatus Acidiferrales bacterium]
MAPQSRVRSILLFIAVLMFACWAANSAQAQDIITVTSCPKQKQETIPLAFVVDCSHVTNPAAKAQCGAFIENAACKISPAYRQITGISLENQCKRVLYTLYEKDNWPYKGGDAGGLTKGCEVDLMTDFSVLLTSSIGPYDYHEMLHVYQAYLGAIPQPHILFGPSMMEAKRLTGDIVGWKKDFNRTRVEMEEETKQYQAGTVRAKDSCIAAEDYVAELLYIQNQKNVYLFYKDLVIGRLKDQADREARFNRMFAAVGGDTTRQFLLEHGCAAF